MDSILAESAKFAEEVLTPLQVIGDEEGEYLWGIVLICYLLQLLNLYIMHLYIFL